MNKDLTVTEDIEAREELIVCAIMWYYDFDGDKAKHKRKQLNATQIQDILWDYEDHLHALGEREYLDDTA